MWWRWPAGEPGRSQVEPAPEQMHGAGFANEAATEPLEHRRYPVQHKPEALSLLRVVGRVPIVFGERDRARDLYRCRPHGCAEAECVETTHELAIERRHRPGFQRHRLLFPG